MAYLRSSSLFGLVGQQPPKFPFGIGTPRRWGLSGLVGQPKPEFPFRLGIGTPPPKAQPPRRRKNRNLGCATCGHPWLGRLAQDDGTFITDFSVPGSPSTLPAPAPTFASSGYNVPDVTSVGPSSVPSPGGFTPVFNNPQASPLSQGGQIATTPQAAAATGGAPVYSIPGPGGTPAPVGSIGGPSASSFGSYLPYIVLGLGGIVLISSLKRR